MVCAQVMGNDVTVGIAAQSGVFQLNVMLPVIAHNLLESAGLLTGAVRVLGSAIANLTVNRERIEAATSRNPILVTALNPVIGYELGAAIAKRAYAEDRSLKDVALEMTDLSAEELDRLLDPAKLTRGGIAGLAVPQTLWVWGHSLSAVRRCWPPARTRVRVEPSPPWSRFAPGAVV